MKMGLNLDIRVCMNLYRIFIWIVLAIFIRQKEPFYLQFTMSKRLFFRFNYSARQLS